jgi:hypothetical protein
MKNYWPESGYLVFGSRNLAARLGTFEWNIALPFFEYFIISRWEGIDQLMP